MELLLKLLPSITLISFIIALIVGTKVYLTKGEDKERQRKLRKLKNIFTIIFFILFLAVLITQKLVS